MSNRAFRRLATVPLLLLLLVHSGCGERAPGGQSAQNTGVSDSEILIGSSLALTGHASFLGSQTLHGVQCYINHINKNGGIYGRRIRLIAHDDMYDPARCVANTQKLVNEDKVFALTSFVGTPTAVKIIPMIEEARIPLVGLFTGATALRVPFRRYILNIRASYHEETGELVRHLVEDLHVTRVAIFYQYDEFGFDGLTGTEIALERYSLEPVAKASYIRGTMNVEEAVDAISFSDAQAVVMIGTYGPCAKFIKMVKERKNGLTFHTVSFVGLEEMVKILGPDAEGVTATQVMPPPWETALLPSARLYSKRLSEDYPEDRPNFVGFEGFINAAVLVEGLRRAGPDPTREGLINALETIQQFSLGIANPLNYSSSDHQGLHQVYMTVVKNGKLMLIDDSGEGCPNMAISPTETGRK